MDAIETFTHNGLTVAICHDDMAENPRTMFDHLATLACWHRRENLGDEQIPGMSEAEIREHARGEILALLPLYLYQHSGMTIRTSPFACRWDSGQVGWAYVTRTSAEAMGCVGDDWTTARLEEAIRGEVAEYDHFLTGQVYGYQVKGRDGEELDSCWGFYGELDYVRGEARIAAEHAEDPAIERDAAELQARATFAQNTEG